VAADANLRRGYPSARVFIAVLHVARSSFSLVRRLNVRVVGMRCSRWPGCPGNRGILRALRARVHCVDLVPVHVHV
jgi:hypothetical protein